MTEGSEICHGKKYLGTYFLGIRRTTTIINGLTYSKSMRYTVEDLCVPENGTQNGGYQSQKVYFIGAANHVLAV
jgi:hypothetical protein